jgi:hypothetical protein
MRLADDDNANITANNKRVIVNDPKHTYFGKWSRVIDTDEAAGRWLVAMDFGAMIEVKREHFYFAPH